MRKRAEHADELVALYGLVSEPGPIAHWDLDMRAGRIAIDDTTTYETSRRGIFAAGDIAVYPNKQMLILSGFHEAALAAFGAAPYIFPDKKIHMQYTTTSPKLHKVLGVETPVFD